MIGKTISHYRVVKQLGSGGMGEVFLAHDTNLDRKVALKFLSAELRKDEAAKRRLMQEAKAVAAIDHPYICRIYEIGEAHGRVFLALEYVEGTTLKDRLLAGPLPSKEIFSIGIEVAEALEEAHDKGIVHRDLKPSNIVITAKGHVKVLDFGLAKSLQPDDGSLAAHDSPTISGASIPALAGTVPYMAPEQLRGDPVDARTDVYALGVLLYEMAVGRRPFRDSPIPRLVGEIQHTPPTPPRRLNRRVPRRLEEIILTCQQKNPAHRYRSMKLLSEALRRSALEGEAEEKSLAVTYFENLSGAPEDEYLRDGMTEDILIELSKIEGLLALPRSSVLAFRNKQVPAADIGRELDVSYVLDGSLRRVGDRLRVTAQLVETRTGRSLWAERYDRRLEDVFAIQDEIARNIAQALRVMLSEDEKRMMAKAPTRNVEAYEYYLRGRTNFRHFRRKSIEYAKQMFAQAIALDPDYAGAYAGLADCFSYLYMFWTGSEENLREAERASRRAVELDPELAEAHVARGVAVSLGKRHERAAEEFETAIRQNPKLFEAYYFYARGYYARGKLEKAVYWFQQARQARPEDYQAPALLGSALRGLGRTEESDAAYRETLRLAEAHLELHPGEARALYFSAIALCQLGEQTDKALELAGRALAMDPDEPQVLYNVACVYALLGQADAAIDCLAKTLAHGEWWKTWAENDPDLASVHDDPRFKALLGPEKVAE